MCPTVSGWDAAHTSWSATRARAPFVHQQPQQPHHSGLQNNQCSPCPTIALQCPHQQYGEEELGFLRGREGGFPAAGLFLARVEESYRLWDSTGHGNKGGS